jgi:hypothetical protein
MTADPPVYEDWYGDTLEVLAQADNIRVTISHVGEDDRGVCVDIPFADVRKVTAAMHAKAGLPDRWELLRTRLERDAAEYADRWKDQEAEDVRTVLRYMTELEAGR